MPSKSSFKEKVSRIINGDTNHQLATYRRNKDDFKGWHVFIKQIKANNKTSGDK